MSSPKLVPPPPETLSPPPAAENLTRVYVWQLPVRMAHWVIVLSIAVLSVTGYYIYQPFLSARGDAAFTMARMRYLHELAAWCFLSAVLVRLYWFFRGNRWAHWRSFLPLQAWWRRGFRKQLRYYLFLERDPDSKVGHNPLAAATYLVVFGVMAVEIATGLALFNHIVDSPVLGWFVNWIPDAIPIRYVREIHFLILFVFLAFMIHHVYSAVLIGIEERSGLMDGIFSGFKFFPAAFVASDPVRGPQDAPVLAAGRSQWRGQPEARP